MLVYIDLASAVKSRAPSGICKVLRSFIKLVRIMIQKIAAFKVPLIGWYGLWEVIPYDGIRIEDGSDKLCIGTGRKHEYQQEKIERESPLVMINFGNTFLKEIARGYCNT
jgi:hypothetical protein